MGEVKKVTLGSIASWVFGVLFGLAGLGLLTDQKFAAGIASLIIAFALLPPANKLLKEKMKFELSTGVKWVIVIVGLVVIGMTTNSDTTPENVAPSTLTPAEVAANAAPKVYGIGDPLQAGSFVWRIKGSERREVIGTSTYLMKQADGEFLILEAEVENIDSSSKYLSANDVVLIDAQNREFKPDSSATLYLGTNDDIMLEDINPGIRKSTHLIYDVPKGLQVAKIKITNGFSSKTYAVKI
jgi:hypothetical protein